MGCSFKADKKTDDDLTEKDSFLLFISEFQMKPTHQKNWECKNINNTFHTL